MIQGFLSLLELGVGIVVTKLEHAPKSRFGGMRTSSTMCKTPLEAGMLDSTMEAGGFVAIDTSPLSFCERRNAEPWRVWRPE